MPLAADIVFMQQALQVARRGWGDTLPNPMVGAVIVEDGRVVAEGYHVRAGEPHAEVNAFENLGRDPAPGATMYVTLEPCCSQGRTPPCTQAIIDAGISRVVVGAIDPDLRHRGLGIEMLKYADIEVETGILEEECEDLNLIYNHWATRNQPLFAAKAAMTLDGRIATRTGNSKWITGPEARKDVMGWRRLFPAIAVGAGTVLADNPSLTSRRKNEEEWCPIRFVFDAKLRTATDPLPKVYSDQYKDHTLVVTSENADSDRKQVLKDAGVRGWVLPDEFGRVSLTAFRQQCKDNGIEGVFFEGGAALLSALLAEKQMDYFFSYRAPKFLADGDALAVLSGQEILEIDRGFSLTKVQHSFFGEDALTRGYVVYPDPEEE